MKPLTTLAAAGMLALAAVAAPAPAQARNEGAIAAGVVGGLAVGALIASGTRSNAYAGAPPTNVYYGPYQYRDCHWIRERVWTNYGPRWRSIRVCN